MDQTFSLLCSYFLFCAFDSRTGHRTHLECVCVSELFIGIIIKTGEGMEREEILEMTDEAE